MTRVAVLIVAYNGTDYLPDCLGSVFAADTDGVSLTCFVLDNASTDDTSQWVRDNYPQVELIRSESNLGFAEGNNHAWRHAKSANGGWDYLYLLNQDTIADRAFLTEAVRYLRDHDHVGAAQSLLMLHPETELINSAGNRLHFLGFGLPTFYREPRDSYPGDSNPESGEINYPSGAAVLIRADLVRETGLFNPWLFMYLEDAELGWRLQLINRPPHLCASSVVYHKYQFKSTLNSYRYLERNRWWLLATHYRLATLILMKPALIAMEIGQWFYAIQHGLAGSKLNATIDFYRPSSIRETFAARKRIQRLRRVSDREILSKWSGEIRSPHLDSWLIRGVANPLFRVYLIVLRWIVRW